MVRFERIVNKPKRNVGDTTVELIKQISTDLKLSPLDVMRNCEEYAPLSKKVSTLKTVAAMFDSLIEKVDVLPLNELLDEVLAKSGYMAYLRGLGDEGVSKIENVQEFYSTVASYTDEAEDPNLNEFLEEVALYTEADRDDNSDDRVTLMTVHSAKGLEYDNVFVVGMEEGIFPGIRSMDSPEDLEEERRLAYVAITRAKKKLYLSNAAQRLLFGQTQRNLTSRFIKEITRELIEKNDNTISLRNQMSNEAVTAVHSSSLQQQLARNKAKSNTKAEAVEYTAGERVMHNSFGEGTVLSVKKMSNDSMLEIAFDKVGTKRLMANFAKLKKI
jgi:DNA helicase-2/ATP-dependent DNA helicase PcrA